MNVFVWDDGKVERLRALVSGGAYYSHIAAELGCTRNAAIGKAKRLGLMEEHPRRGASESGVVRSRSVRKVRIRQGRSRKVQHSVPQAVPIEKPALEERTVEEGSSRGFYGVSRWDEEMVHHETQTFAWTEEVTSTMACMECLTQDMCRWPVRSSPYQCCGAPRVARLVKGKKVLSPYCARHLRRSIGYKRGEKE